MYCWPEKKAKAPETPLDLDYSSCGDFDDHQPLMADSGSIVTSEKRPIAIQRNSSFFENISQNNNPESSEWQPKQIPADMGAAQEEGEFGEYKKKLIPQVPSKEQKASGVQLMHSQKRLYEDFNTNEKPDVTILDED